MKFELYLPGATSPETTIEEVSGEGVAATAAALIEIATGITAPEVDVLASGAGYSVFVIFDFTGARNVLAETVCAEICGEPFGEDEDSELRGPVVVVSL